MQEHVPCEQWFLQAGCYAGDHCSQGKEHVTRAYKMNDSGFSLRSVMTTQNDTLKQCKGR